MEDEDEHLRHGDHVPCVQIRALVSGHDPKTRNATWIVVMDEIFQAVLDESGYRADDPRDVFVFAGYIGKVRDWEDFMHSWNGLLTQYPELQDTDVVKGLARWQGRFSDPRMLQLMRVVTDNPKLGSVRWLLPYAAYRSVNVTHAAGGDESLYFFAWYGVLFGLLGTIRGTPNASLQFFYDENIYEEPKVQLGYDQLRKWLHKNNPDVLKMLPHRPTPKNDKDFWPVRAADALAWNTHRSFICEQEGVRFSNPLWRMLDSGPQALKWPWNAEEVREVLGPPKRIRKHLERLANQSNGSSKK